MVTQTDNQPLIKLARFLKMPGAGWPATDIVETAINRMKTDDDFIKIVSVELQSHKILRTRKA